MIRANNRGDAQVPQYIRGRGDGALALRKGFIRTLRLIDFTDFKIEYWRRFPARFTKGILEDLAFMEIMGVIKGSMSFVSDPEPLSRDAYINKRWKLAPSFATDGERDAVYSIYESYERLKKTRSETDNIDRVIHVAKALNKNPDLWRRVEKFLDEVYVDGEYKEKTFYQI